MTVDNGPRVEREGGVAPGEAEQGRRDEREEELMRAGESRGPVETPVDEDATVVVRRFLDGLFKAGELDIRTRIETDGEVVVGELGGPDLRLLTGSEGRGLDALQYLCNRVLNRRMAHHPPVHLDTDGFKNRRARRLQDEAESAADEAVRSGRPVVLGPYTPAARREIHLALADDPAVETQSDGDGFLKRVVIRPRRRR